MKVLLIYPDLNVHVSFPIGMSLIASVLAAHGHSTRIIHYNEEIGNPLDLDDLDAQIGRFEPELIAFSSVSNQYKYVKIIAAHIKKKYDVPTVLGGVHGTITPGSVLLGGDIDIVVMGEGELAIVELTKKLENKEDYSALDNIATLVDGAVRINPLRKLLDRASIDTLPFPDRSGFNYGLILEKKRGWANVMAGRGCVRKCTYCVNHFFHKIYADKNSPKEMLRCRSVDRVIEEIHQMVAEYPAIQIINIDDDNLAFDKNWLTDFCAQYSLKIKLPFACNVHPSTFDADIAKMLAEAGCNEIKIGLEAGSERLRRDVLKRIGSDESIEKAFAVAAESGIRSWSFNMIGMPTETEEEILLTAKLNARIRPYIIRCSIFYPYEGTDLFRYSEEHNLIDHRREEDVSSHFEDSILDMPQLPPQQIVKMKTMFKWYVDSQSDTEAAPLFRELIRAFDKLPDDAWLSGSGKELFKTIDGGIDNLLREARLEHYATRGHLDLNFTQQWGWQLP